MEHGELRAEANSARRGTTEHCACVQGEREARERAEEERERERHGEGAERVHGGGRRPSGRHASGREETRAAARELEALGRKRGCAQGEPRRSAVGAVERTGASTREGASGRAGDWAEELEQAGERACATTGELEAELQQGGRRALAQGSWEKRRDGASAEDSCARR
jgi:hypothetical protein